MAVLPALVGQALLGLAGIFHEAVAVAVAVGVDPFQRELELRPDRPDRAEIARDLVILRCQHHEERRAVDGAVIVPEGHLAEHRHLAATGLVQHLSGLRVGGRIDGLGLRRGEEPQHALAEVRVDPERHHRRDDAVASEHRGVPGDAREGVDALLRPGRQHVEVGGGPAEPLVELIVRGDDRGDARCDLALVAPVVAVGAGEDASLAQAAIRLLGEAARRPRERRRRGFTRPLGAGRAGIGPVRLADDADEEGGLGPRLQLDHELGLARFERVGLGPEMQGGGAHDLVEAGVAELHLRLAAPLDGAPAPVRAIRAPDLEQVAVIGIEGDADAQPPPPGVVVAQANPVVAGALEQELGALEGDQLAGDRGLVARIEPDVGRGEIDAERPVVVLDRRGQHHRPLVLDGEGEARKVARVLEVEALRPRIPADIAVAVEHGEGLAVFQGAQGALHQ